MQKRKKTREKERERRAREATSLPSEWDILHFFQIKTPDRWDVDDVFEGRNRLASMGFFVIHLIIRKISVSFSFPHSRARARSLALCLAVALCVSVSFADAPVVHRQWAIKRRLCTVMMTWEIVINLLHHQFSLSFSTLVKKSTITANEEEHAAPTFWPALADVPNISDLRASSRWGNLHSAKV